MDGKAQIDSALVEEFVRQSHGNLERVQELVTQEPGLVNATWDWGGGDWESGLGAASHVGNRDIALFLLGKGARMDIFAAAMLGELDVVRGAVESYPEAINTPGPHGIPLIAHARMGGDEASSVLEYLKSFDE